MDEEMEKISEYVRRFLQDFGAHGFDHIVRVTRISEILGSGEGADMKVLIPAALLHDIARPIEDEMGLPHEEKGAEMAEVYLRSINYSEECIPAITHAIRAHRYTKGIPPKTPEAKILSDADKLDAMGAFGIARTFMQAGEEDTGINGAVDHINEKLLKLKEKMYTEGGKKIAEQRHAFLKFFLEELAREDLEKI